MGTPEFAVHILDRILETGYPVVGVVTAPDKPAGRGRKIQLSPVKAFAQREGLRILQPVNLKSEPFLEALRELQADLQIVVAFRMLPREVWEIPRLGTFNLHASLLPQYRGAAPINWALINGENKTGVTTFFIDERIDTGEILLQKEVEISETDDAGDLHDRLMKVGAEIVLQTIQEIVEQKVTRRPQAVTADQKKAHKLSRENTRISWDLPLRSIRDHIRGLSPHPVAWTYFQNGNQEITLKIFRAEILPEDHRFEPGKVILDHQDLKIATQEGFVVPKEVQLPGKRRMKVEDLLNGYRIFPNAKVF